MKQTEIGLIPDDWEVKNIIDILIPSKDNLKIGPFGSQLKKELLLDNGIYKVFGQENIYTGDFKHCYRFLTKEYFQKLQSCELKSGDFVISTMGTIGKCDIVPENAGAGIMDSHLVRLRLSSSIDKIFFKHFFQSEIIQKQISALSVGGIMDGLSATIIRKLNVLCLPKQEQQRIAKALSDVDALISTTEKLIQKKKNIKLGTMQNLLTGKKRLPGFGPQTKSPAYKQTELGPIPEDWDVKSLGELFDMKAGGDVDKEHFSYCKSSIYKYKIFSNGLENEGIYGYTDLPKYKGNAITITGRGTVGIAMFREEDFDAVIRLLVLNSKNDNLTNNSYITEEINSCISFPNESTGVPQLTVPQIRDIVIALPSKEEQTAIANVLSSMDKEIETLNTKLEKYRNLKTAMMQQFLTGKIRLK